MGAVRRRFVYWLCTLLAVYALLVLAMYLLQDRLVFPGAGLPVRGLPPIDGLQGGTLMRAEQAGFRYVTCESTGPAQAVALWFVGNGEDLQSAALGATELARYGLYVVGVEHPGYGASKGPPAVDTLLGAAEVAAALARNEATARGVPLLAIGRSLGTFCAVHLAARGLVDRLLLFAPPTSMAAAAQARFWWLPVGLLLRHRFDNLGKAGQVRCPVLVVHGDRDDIVPLALGQQLCAAFAGPKELLVATGCGHNDLPIERQGPFGERLQAFCTGR